MLGTLVGQLFAAVQEGCLAFWAVTVLNVLGATLAVVRQRGVSHAVHATLALQLVCVDTHCEG